MYTRIIILLTLIGSFVSNNVFASQWEVSIHEATAVPTCKNTVKSIVESDNKLLVQLVSRRGSASNENSSLFLNLRSIADLYDRYRDDSKQNVVFQFCKKTSGKNLAIQCFLPYKQEICNKVTTYWESTVKPIVTKEEIQEATEEQTVITFVANNNAGTSPVDIFIREYEQQHRGNNTTDLRVSLFHSIDETEKAYELSEKAVEQFKNHFFSLDHNKIPKAGMFLHFTLNQLKYKVCLDQTVCTLLNKYRQAQSVEQKSFVSKDTLSNFPNAVFMDSNDNDLGETNAIKCTLIQEKQFCVIMATGMADVKIALFSEHDAINIKEKNEPFCLLVERDFYHITQVDDKVLDIAPSNKGISIDRPKQHDFSFLQKFLLSGVVVSGAFFFLYNFFCFFISSQSQITRMA